MIAERYSGAGVVFFDGPSQKADISIVAHGALATHYLARHSII